MTNLNNGEQGLGGTGTLGAEMGSRPHSRTVVGSVLAVALIGGLAVAARQSSAPPNATVPTSASSQPVSARLDVAQSDLFRQIAEAQTPVVVNIRTESRQQTRDLTQFFGRDGLLERFFGMPEIPQVPGGGVSEGAGSGFVISEDGVILTNNHVVAGATRISVGLYAHEDEEYDARVIGRDPLTDSALIQFTQKPDGTLPVARLGNSGAVKPGDWVMAIGNPFNLAHTVTVGVISATDRPFPLSEGRREDVLQTDAAINPGNSGGPLLNLRGEVIGINTAILSGGPGAGNVGVGFAVPIDTVRELLPELRGGTITRGRIGVQVTPVTKALVAPLGLDAARGALVRMVERGGPAAAAGITAGDVIVSFSGKPIARSDELSRAVSRTKPGTSVPVDVVRGGRRQTLTVTVAALESDPDQQRAVSGGSSERRFGVALGDLSADIRGQLNLPGSRAGALVTNVEQGGAAARAGMRPGDVILQVNRKPVTSAGDAAAALRAVPEKDVALVLVWRERNELLITIPGQN
jgi:serine protease Do